MVCAFTREGESSRERKVDVVLGRLERGKLLKRIPTYKKSLERLMYLMPRSDVVFVYTLDNFLFAWMAKTAVKSDIKIVLFVLDIRKMFVGDSVFNHITQSFLLFAFERCELILVSSRYYIEDYAARFLNKVPERWLEIENKINPFELVNDNSEVEITRDSSDQLIIGYFGLIRCEHSLETLFKLVDEADGKFRVIIRGVFFELDGVAAIIEKQKWVSYGGPYNNPDDLSSIYNSCDIVWACYPFSGEKWGNHQWAKTNRFYEACFFQKPLITCIGSKDGEQVETAGIGMSVDLSTPEQAAQSLLSISGDRVKQWKSSLQSLPQAEFVYTNEFELLFCELEAIRIESLTDEK